MKSCTNELLYTYYSLHVWRFPELKRICLVSFRRWVWYGYMLGDLIFLLPSHRFSPATYAMGFQVFWTGVTC